MKVDIGENYSTKKKKGNLTNNLFMQQHLEKIEYLVHNMHLCYYVIMVEHESGFGSDLYFRIADISFISIPRQAAV
jgi:hypothetical protein